MHTFHDFGIDERIIKSLDELSIVQPTEIQQKSLPELLGKEVDFLGLAQTGSGKTAAFGLPLLERIDPDGRYVQTIVLSPTRELAQQIEQQLKAFSKYLKGIEIACVYGGTPINAQIKQIKNRIPQVVVATPGRLIDLVQRKALILKKVDLVVLDEADEMLNMGFKEDIDTILSSTGKEKNTWLFSATMPEEIRRITKQYMHDYVEIGVQDKQHVNLDISHQYAVVKRNDREAALQRFMDLQENVYGLIFCRTKAETQRLATSMSDAGYAVDAIHGDLSQSQRNNVMRKFKKGQVTMLAATDVAARGIDVDQLTHVFHYNLPDDLAFYTHRSGRTGRAGNKGVALSIIAPNEVYKIKHLTKKLGIKMERVNVPTLGEVKMKRIEHVINDMMMTEANDEARSWVYSFADHLEHISKEELMAKLITRSLKLMSSSGKDDLNASERDERHHTGKAKAPISKRDKREADKHMKTFEINIGRTDKIQVGDLLKVICDITGVRSRYIGRINMNTKHSFFDVDESKANGVVESFKNLRFKGRPLNVKKK